MSLHAVSKSFVAFCTAIEEPLTFSAPNIIDWMIDWCREGFMADGLNGRLSHLRRFARKMRSPFPGRDSYDWLDIVDVRRALLKIDPSSTQRATVLDLFWITQVIEYIGIKQLSDYQTCKPWACQLAVRLLLTHCCCMRGVEHRTGCRVGDIRLTTGIYLLFSVAERWSQKKLKMRPGRQCILPRFPHHASAGSAMVEYCLRYHRFSGPQDLLFPRIVMGEVDRAKASTDAQFISMTKQMLEEVGMKPEDLRHITNHSLRAGGATDWSSAGMSDTFIGDQGGWTSRCFRIYIRPTAVHCWSSAVTMIQKTLGVITTGRDYILSRIWSTTATKGGAM